MTQYLTYIKSILFALLFLGGTGLTLWMLSLHITSLGNTLHNTIQVVADDERFSEEYNSLSTLLVNTQSQRDKLKTFILEDEHDTITLLSEIDQLANEKQVELQTSRLDTKETTGVFDELTATFKVTGPESAVMQMIGALEALPYHSNMNNLNISRSVSAETGATEVSADVSLLISIQKHD